MSRNTNSIDSVNHEALLALEKLGQRIRANRIAQGWTVKDMASRLFCSQNTYRSIEAGKPTSSIGVVANALWLLGLIDSINDVAPVSAKAVSVRRVRAAKKGVVAGVISEDERDF